MSSFSNISSQRVMVGETEIQSFHIPVSEPSPRQRRPTTFQQQLQQGQNQQPPSAGKYQVPRSVGGPPIVNSTPNRPNVPQTVPGTMVTRTTPSISSPGPKAPQVINIQPVAFRPSINAPSSSSSPPPPPVASSVPSSSTTATSNGRPGLMRTSSFADPKTMADMGLSPPVIQRLASVDPSAVAKHQAAREAAQPDIAKAERYRNLTCPRVRDVSKGTYSLYSIWKFADREFLQYGLGVMLWFKLSRRLAYLFFGLFILNLPSLIFNILGPDADSIAFLDQHDEVSAFASNSSTIANPLKVRTGTVDGTYGLSYTTLAHQGLVLNATILGYSKQEVGLVVGSLDTLSTLVFFIVTWWIFRDHTKHSTLYNSTVMTVRRFTVLVTNLPDTRPVLGRLDIADFFQRKFGPVVDVSIAYNDIHLVQLFKERGEMKREIQSLEMQGKLEERDELAKKLVVFDKTIMFKRKIFRKRIMAAFVTFQYQESVSKCLAAYPNTWWSTCTMPRDLRFHLRAPKVTRAAEPSNTLFHNLGLSYGDQWCRRAWTGLVSLAFMSVSFIAVFISQYYQNRIPTTTDCATNVVVMKQQVETEQEKFCYCGGLSTEELYSESGFCSAYLYQYAIAKGLIFMTAFSTVIVNFLLQVFMDRLAVLERHSSVTSQQRGVTSRLFWGLFFNTGVIILIVNADIAAYLGGDFSLLRHLLPGKYGELSPDWFYEIGVSILITMFLNTQNPHILSLVAIPYDACRRKKCARYKKSQNELNELYQGRRFVLFERYSVLLNTVFVCMMYSSGMPILWLVASLTFASTYWMDKITFLRNYRIPPRYDESLDEYTGKMIQFAVVPHLLMALWFFTSPMTNSLSLGSAVPLVSESSIGPIRTGVLDLRQRFLQWNTFPTLLLLLLFVGIYLAKKVLEFIFFCRASEAEKRNLRLGVEEKKSRSRAVTYQEACQKIGLESYRLSRQTEYRTAYMATESRKQLPAELDLYQLREQEEAEAKQGKHRRKPSSMKELKKHGKRGAEPTDAKSIQVKPKQVVPLSSSSSSPPPAPAEAWVAAPGAPPAPARASSPLLASETKTLPNSASSTRSHVSSGSASLSLAGGQPQTPPGPLATPPPGVTNAAPTTVPIASINQMSDAVVLTMAAAVADSALSAESTGFTLLPISCPTCSNLFQIVDVGEAMSYTCPFCQAQTII